MIRRLIDILVASLTLLVVWPIMLIVALWIRLDSSGPAIFVQMRVGLRGELFRFYKFRTMQTDVDPYGHSPKTHNDARLTRSGKWLRKSSLDELPQLFNVLRGEMTLVGPRPLLPWQYEEWTPHQRRRCDVKPGLTGWAQVNGRAGITHEDKIELDVWYVEHRSVALDLRIIGRTIVQTVRGQDILEKTYSKQAAPPADTKSNSDDSSTPTA